MFINPLEFAIDDGNLILLNSRGFSFVFFFTPECIYCDDVKPAFDKMSEYFKGCNFYYCNVRDSNDYLIKITSFSKFPITYVPIFLLFVDGKIIGRFFPDEDNPINNNQNMANFIKNTTTQYMNKINHPNIEKTNSIAPLTTIGIPYNRSMKKVCKLYSEAYNTK